MPLDAVGAPRGYMVSVLLIVTFCELVFCVAALSVPYHGLVGLWIREQVVGDFCEQIQGQAFGAPGLCGAQQLFWE